MAEIDQIRANTRRMKLGQFYHKLMKAKQSILKKVNTVQDNIIKIDTGRQFIQSLVESAD